MNDLRFKLTHQHPVLGKLNIEFVVTTEGNVFLESIKLRVRSRPYASFNFYVIYFWRDYDERWAMNYWERKWANGAAADSGASLNDTLNLFTPALLDFANSEALQSMIVQRINQWLRRLQNARNSLRSVSLGAIYDYR